MKASGTRRVQHQEAKRAHTGSAQATPEELAALKARIEELEVLADHPKWAKRRYPAETAGTYLCKYLESLSKSHRKKEPFVEWVSALQKVERARLKNRTRITELRRALDEGLVAARKLRRVSPRSSESTPHLAALILFSKNLLHRIRLCQNCGACFFSRFKHQKFCRNPQTNCRWSYYHTPERLKDYRQRNLKKYQDRDKRYQREYRRKLFEKLF
jgi:hypothetical protein